ncbi:hypothetical protein H6P81_004192 [Aristolochia fimbriata]|uniref:Uncharacterized protein n=1 Tax=Aristolochia fimbriata TaxID=158543 RepID=A0AAV7FGJ8_ARIFI|nr:hypothetical protein H6P81_004192 [Aristolochia fimbriata]
MGLTCMAWQRVARSQKLQYMAVPPSSNQPTYTLFGTGILYTQNPKAEVKKKLQAISLMKTDKHSLSNTITIRVNTEKKESGTRRRRTKPQKATWTLSVSGGRKLTGKSHMPGKLTVN